MKGFILINTIYILSLLALIVLTSQKTLQLDMQIVNGLKQYYEDFEKLEKTALEILTDDEFRTQNNCNITNYKNIRDGASIIKNGCNKMGIYYVISDLGEYKCLRTKIDGNYFATHHYFLQIVNKNLPSKILQIRYVLPGLISPCDSSVHRIIAVGILSWNIASKLAL